MAFERVSRHDLVDQTHAQRLLGGELASGIEDLARTGRADQIDEPADAVIGVAKSELGRRNAKARALGGDPQIARQGGADTAADAITGYHRDRRLGGFLQTLPRALGDLAVTGDRFLGRALLLEFGDIGARDKSSTARAADDNHADCLV